MADDRPRRKTGPLTGIRQSAGRFAASLAAPVVPSPQARKNPQQ